MLRQEYNQKAFTTVELLIVTAIVLIFAYLAAPNLNLLNTHQELNIAENTIVKTLNRAKKIATSENTFIDIVITDNNIQFSPRNSTKKINVSIPNRIAFNESVNLTFNANGVLVGPGGSPLGAETSLVIKPKSSSMSDVSATISISTTGMVVTL